MTEDHIIVGLDVGTTKTAVAIGRVLPDRQIEILGVGSESSPGVRRGVIINIEATLKSVAGAIEAAEQMAGYEVTGVYASVSGAHIGCLNSRGVVAVTGRDREIEPADVNRVLDAARAVVVPVDREVLHVVPREYLVDEQGGIKDPLNMIGVRLEAEVHIITGSGTSAHTLIRCVNRAGFKVNAVEFSGLASATAVLTEAEKDLGVLLIDIGGGTTDVVFFTEGAPSFTAVLPLGGKQVTGDLNYLLKTPMESAEVLKREAGSCFLDGTEEEARVAIAGVGGQRTRYVDRSALHSIIRERMQEIFSMVQKLISQSGIRGSLGGGVVLTGGGSLLHGTVQLAEATFQCGVRVGSPIVRGAAERFATPEYAAVIGLVQRAAASVEVPEHEGAVLESRSRPKKGIRDLWRTFFG